MNDNDWEKFLAAYRAGATADIVQAEIAGEWGPIWTIPPCSPEAAERIGRQMTRSRARWLRYVRRARLRLMGDKVVEALVVTDLPSDRQVVVRLMDGVELQVSALLEDEALRAIRSTFVPAYMDRPKQPYGSP